MTEAKRCAKCGEQLPAAGSAKQQRGKARKYDLCAACRRAKHFARTVLSR